MGNKRFTSNVSSGELLNVPAEFADLNNVEKGDTLEVEVVAHKKDGQGIVYERDEQTQSQ